MDERKKILELLEAGKINPDEARKLLEALKRSYSHDSKIEIDCNHMPPWVAKEIFTKFGHHRHHHPRKKVIIKMVGDEDCC